MQTNDDYFLQIWSDIKMQYLEHLCFKTSWFVCFKHSKASVLGPCCFVELSQCSVLIGSIKTLLDFRKNLMRTLYQDGLFDKIFRFPIAWHKCPLIVKLFFRKSERHPEIRCNGWWRLCVPSWHLVFPNR